MSLRRRILSRNPPAVCDKACLQSGGPIAFRGGPVLAGQVNVYMIYYGNWGGRSSNVLENFVISLSNNSTTPSAKGTTRATDWWKILREYYDRLGNHVGEVNLGGKAFDSYSQGKDLTGRVDKVVLRAITAHTLPADPKGVYMVLPSKDVVESPMFGFCAGTWPPLGPVTGYCGWHESIPWSNGTLLRYAFVGNADQCTQRCGHLEGHRSTPNGNVGIDAMVNVLAHELAEAVTDVWSTGWVGPGGENGDLCNRLWGALSLGPNGSYVYNLVGQGGMRWLVQLMWDPETQSCRMQPS